MALWGGRFSAQADDILRVLNDSIHFDRRLYRQDIAGSIAYAGALVEADILSPEEAKTIIKGLEAVRTEFETDTFELHAGDEDIHTAVERRLVELVGEVGKKLHTGRSRNDQVATDFRLWCKQAIVDLDSLLAHMQEALIAQAEQHIDTLIPGYTHLQPAQPITAAHWLMSFFWMLSRDRQRLQQTGIRLDVSPLGAGALAGSPLNYDRQMLAQSLGFASCSHNSLDAVSDRDFVAEILFDLSLVGVHLSRLAEDLIIYSNPAFGYVLLDDRYSTGSSLMPQKRNADPMELARGKAGRMIGHLTGLLVTLKGLPSGYNKDLQEDKEALFDAVDTFKALLPVLTAVVQTLVLDSERSRAGLQEDMLATDLADYLVEKGIPFREAHHIIGQIVQTAQEKTVSLSQLSLADYQSINPTFEQDLYAWLDFDASVQRRSILGGTAPIAVQKQIDSARQWLKDL
jgi:argininosuccinate lyase